MRKILLVLVFLSMATSGFCATSSTRNTAMDIRAAIITFLVKLGANPTTIEPIFDKVLATLIVIAFFIYLYLANKFYNRFPHLRPTPSKPSKPFIPPQQSEPRRDSDAFTESDITDSVGTRLGTYQETSYEIRLVSANGRYVAVYKKDDKRTYDCVGRLIGGGNQLARFIPTTPFGGAR